MIVSTIINICPRKILILYAVLIVAWVQFSRSTAKPIDNGSVCRTSLCEQIAKIIINTVNQTVDPCENFFEYACGNIDSNNQIDNITSMNFFDILQNRTQHRMMEILESNSLPNESIALTKSKQLYKACMDTNAIEEEGLTRLLRQIDELGGWPMTMSRGKWKLRQKPWQDIDLMMRKNLGHTAFFIISVAPNLEDSTSHIQLLSPPILPGESHVFTRLLISNNNVTVTMNKTANTRYHGIILDSARIIAKYQNSQPNITQLEIDAKDVMRFELELLNISITATLNALTQINSNHVPITIDELQKRCDTSSPKSCNGKMNWLNYIRRLYSDVPNVNVSGSEKIAVVTQEYFVDLISLLDRTPSRVIVNTMHWWLIKELAITLKNELKDLIYDKTFQESRPRWKFCIARNELHHAISQSYMQKYPFVSRRYVSDMVQELIVSMKNYIDNSNWLDNDSKNEALKKLSKMKDFIAYPDWYENHEFLSNYYANLEVGASFYHNTLSLSKFNFLRTLGLLRQPVDKNVWVGRTTDVNAYYYYPGNSLTIPAGILQFPMFDQTQPDVLNYGALGFVIAHEISHGFDNNGRLYDEIGNLRDWWSNTTKSEYNRKVQCFIDEFSKYKITHNNNSYQLNAVRTLSENIADTTGINALFKAFKIHSKEHPAQANIKLPGLEHLNSDKLLFIIWARTMCERPKSVDLMKQIRMDNHSPVPYRILGTLANINSFSDTYQCAKGTVMNPVDKCGIW